MSFDLVKERWRAFGTHCRTCSQCDYIRKWFIRALADSLHLPHFEDVWEGACEDGRPLLEAWKSAVDVAVEEHRTAGLA